MAKKTDDETSGLGGGEARWPAAGEPWETRHTLLVVLAIERWWKRVPVERRNAARALIADIIGQRDLQEVAK
jgi:hypothetical protein